MVCLVDKLGDTHSMDLKSLLFGLLTHYRLSAGNTTCSPSTESTRHRSEQRWSIEVCPSMQQTTCCSVRHSRSCADHEKEHCDCDEAVEAFGDSPTNSMATYRWCLDVGLQDKGSQDVFRDMPKMRMEATLRTGSCEQVWTSKYNKTNRLRLRYWRSRQLSVKWG